MNVIIKNIPNSLTLANLSCGLIAIIFTFQADFSSATICVIIGLLFDFLDGLVARILNVKSEEAPKVVKKLRFRNFPSIALFFDGSKKETWKADMDGEVDCSSKEIKGAIDDMLAEDVF